MKKSHEILKNAIDQAGVKSVASSLNLSKTLIYKWCEESPQHDNNLDASGSINPLDRIKKIFDATEDMEIIHWICALADGHFVKNVQLPDQPMERDIFKNIEKLVKEFSDALSAISQSYTSEDDICIEEAEEIRQEWEELKRVGEYFVKACESGMFRKNPGTSQ